MFKNTHETMPTTAHRLESILYIRGPPESPYKRSKLKCHFNLNSIVKNLNYITGVFSAVFRSGAKLELVVDGITSDLKDLFTVVFVPYWQIGI